MRVIYPKNRLNQTNKHFVLKLKSFNSGNYKSANRQLQNSGQLQNSTVNGAVSSTINCVIIISSVLQENLSKLRNEK